MAPTTSSWFTPSCPADGRFLTHSGESVSCWMEACSSSDPVSDADAVPPASVVRANTPASRMPLIFLFKFISSLPVLIEISH